MTDTVLGIDIGVNGAVAMVDLNGKLLDVWPMPCLDDGPAKRRSINAPLLAKLVFDSHATLAYVERVGVRPGEGAVGAFQFGDCAGVVRGVLAAAAIPTQLIMPSVWKRIIGIPPGKEGAKDAARSEAIRRWPAEAGRFKRKKDADAAEAALIAVAGLAKFYQAATGAEIRIARPRGVAP